MSNLHFFGLRTEAGLPGEIPHWHRENTKSPNRKNPAGMGFKPKTFLLWSDRDTHNPQKIQWIWTYRLFTPSSLTVLHFSIQILDLCILILNFTAYFSSPGSCVAEAHLRPLHLFFNGILVANCSPRVLCLWWQYATAGCGLFKDNGTFWIQRVN